MPFVSTIGLQVPFYIWKWNGWIGISSCWQVVYNGMTITNKQTSWALLGSKITKYIRFSQTMIAGKSVQQACTGDTITYIHAYDSRIHLVVPANDVAFSIIWPGVFSSLTEHNGYSCILNGCLHTVANLGIQVHWIDPKLECLAQDMDNTGYIVSKLH